MRKNIQSFFFCSKSTYRNSCDELYNLKLWQSCICICLHQFQNISKIKNKNKLYMIQATIRRNNCEFGKKVMMTKRTFSIFSTFLHFSPLIYPLLCTYPHIFRKQYLYYNKFIIDLIIILHDIGNNIFYFYNKIS